MGKTFNTVARSNPNKQETTDVLENRAVSNMLNALWNTGFSMFNDEDLIGSLRKEDGTELVSSSELKNMKDPMSAVTGFFEKNPNGKLQIMTPGETKPRWLSKDKVNGQSVFSISDTTVPEPEKKEKPGFFDYIKSIFSKAAREKIANWNRYKEETVRYETFVAKGSRNKPLKSAEGEDLKFELIDINPESVKAAHSAMLDKDPSVRSVFENNYFECQNDPKMREFSKHALLAQTRLSQGTMLQHNEDMKNFNNGFYAGNASLLYTVWAFNKVAGDESLQNKLSNSSVSAILADKDLRSEFKNQFASIDNKNSLDVNAFEKFNQETLGNTLKVRASDNLQKQEAARQQRHDQAMNNPQNEIEKMYRDFSGKSQNLKALGDRAMESMNNVNNSVNIKMGIRENMGMDGLNNDFGAGLAHDMGTVTAFRLACHHESYRQALEKFGPDDFVKKITGRKEFIRKVEGDHDVFNDVNYDALKYFSKDCGAFLESRVNEDLMKSAQNNNPVVDKMKVQINNPTIKQPEIDSPIVDNNKGMQL